MQNNFSFFFSYAGDGKVYFIHGKRAPHGNSARRVRRRLAFDTSSPRRRGPHGYGESRPVRGQYFRSGVNDTLPPIRGKGGEDSFRHYVRASRYLRRANFYSIATTGRRVRGTMNENNSILYDGSTPAGITSADGSR